MHAACRIVTRGSCCTKRFAEFNGNCESYCSLEQLIASLSVADEGKSASGTYHPKTEGYYTRSHLYKPPSLLYCVGCTWTRISRQPIIAITWHFSQQTLLEPLAVTGARAFSVNDIGMYCVLVAPVAQRYHVTSDTLGREFDPGKRDFFH